MSFYTVHVFDELSRVHKEVNDDDCVLTPMSYVRVSAHDWIAHYLISRDSDPLGEEQYWIAHVCVESEAKLQWRRMVRYIAPRT